jgi:hypothetical protein
MSDTLEVTCPQIARVLPFGMTLELVINDADVMRELEKYPEGQERDEFAIEALKIGILALRRASTAFDGEFIQRETDRMLDTLQERLNSHAEISKARLETSLKSYFDPDSGHFTQRVSELTTENGGLAKLLKESLDGDKSKLAQTMVALVGEHSPLMKYLSPDQSDGLLTLLKTNVESQLQTQQARILSEFSLDNPNGALNQMIERLTTKHGTLSKDLQDKIDEVIKEFSLDKPDSSLNRLVHKVNQAQQTITNEFSLDNEQSALRRLKTELTTILSAHIEASANFQQRVNVALEKLVTKREVEARGTLHGGAFEEVVFEFLSREAQNRGDVAECTGNKVGLMKNRKCGDAVIHLGVDCSAAGARIVVEAKEDKDYDLVKAQGEIELARKNRGAQIGVFVFSQKTAPPQLNSFLRQGNDLFVAWDAEDPITDPYFKAAIEVARALCVRACQESLQQKIDFTPIDKAVLEIEKRIANMQQVLTWANTIKNKSEDIIKQTTVDRNSLCNEIDVLRQEITNVRRFLDASSEEVVIPSPLQGE